MNGKIIYYIWSNQSNLSIQIARELQLRDAQVKYISYENLKQIGKTYIIPEEASIPCLLIYENNKLSFYLYKREELLMFISKYFKQKNNTINQLIKQRIEEARKGTNVTKKNIEKIQRSREEIGMMAETMISHKPKKDSFTVFSNNDRENKSLNIINNNKIDGRFIDSPIKSSYHDMNSIIKDMQQSYPRDTSAKAWVPIQQDPKMKLK